ncbi:MAG: hypothetical protein ACE5HD_00305 [Acidobacteriota bacterium]
MHAKPERRLNLDWVSVRYRSVVLTAMIVLGLAAGIWLVWFQYNGRNSPRALAGRAVDAAQALYHEAGTYTGGERLAAIRSKAREYLSDARRLFGQGRFEESRVKAILSRNNSQKIIDIARSEETTHTEVRLYKITGQVSVKRSGDLIWEDASIDEPLRLGDAIKTASRSSAQIIYFDGSITTVKPGSLVQITNLTTDPDTRQVKVTESLRVGGVRAAAFGSKVKGSFHEVATRNTVARAETSERAEFEVDYDGQKESTRLSVHQGTAALSVGEKSVTLQAAERLSVAGNGEFGPKEQILPAPRLIAPGDQKIFLAGDPKPIHFLWSEVSGARKYQIQLSPDSLMADVPHDLVHEGGTALDFARPEEGAWFWRVAGMDEKGRVGQFSPVSRFRVGQASASLGDDTVPPALEVSEFLQTGNLVIITGRTDADANLWVENQKVDVYDDGTFTAVVRLHREGRNRLEIVAQDPAGNETVARREAYLEVF